MQSEEHFLKIYSLYSLYKPLLRKLVYIFYSLYIHVLKVAPMHSVLELVLLLISLYNYIQVVFPFETMMKYSL